jgi:hypothetical protein
MDFRDERSCKSYLGLSFAELDLLSTGFELKYTEYLILNNKNSRRKFGGGRKGVFPTAKDKVCFCLHYLKSYPTFDVLAHHYGISRSSAHEAIHKMIPVMLETLKLYDVLPKDQFASVEEMEAYFEKKN